MPPSGSIDIPHVNITDHYISRQNIYQPNRDTVSTEKQEEIAGFLGLKSLVLPSTTDLQMAQAYLALWDKFMASEAILDSAKFYLDRSSASKATKLNALTHYYFNKQEFALLGSIAPPAIDISNAWTAYRIGEAANKMKLRSKATAYYKRAADLMPYNLNFQEKLGTAYAQSQLFKEAEKVFVFVLKEDPRRKKSLSNLGLIKAQKGQLNEALKLYDLALAADPDYKMALLNKIGVLIQLNRKTQAQPLIKHLLDKYPEYRSVLHQKGLVS
jgi:tetratricopeptide (TPR) repeat protein